MQSSKVETIKASRDLQIKVGKGNISPNQIQRAQSIIENNKVEFAPLAKPHLKALKEAVAEAVRDVKDSADILEDIMAPIMNLKANAATFNYPLITEISAVILTFIETVKRVDHEIVEILENFYKTMSVIISQEIYTSQNPVGSRLLDEFRQVCRRYMTNRY